MIWQLQHQHKKTGEHRFISQRELSEGHDQFRQWLEETNQSHPLPKDYQWLACNEKSEFFYVKEVS
jgi:hypothetical protein